MRVTDLQPTDRIFVDRWLPDLLQQHFIKHSDLARVMRIDPSIPSLWCNGKRSVPQDRLEALAEALELLGVYELTAEGIIDRSAIRPGIRPSRGALLPTGLDYASAMHIVESATLLIQRAALRSKNRSDHRCHRRSIRSPGATAPTGWMHLCGATTMGLCRRGSWGRSWCSMTGRRRPTCDRVSR